MAQVISKAVIEKKIYMLRGRKVMLDADVGDKR